MNKIGLKLWNINTDFYFEEAKKLYTDGVFDYIELYIVPENSDKLEKWKTLDIPFDIHAPHYAHGMNLSKKECRTNNKKLYEEVKKYADALNSSVIIFHGGSGGDYKETAIQLQEFNDLRILVENKPYDTLPFVKEPYYVGAKIKELLHIKNVSGCGFCLDVGHGMCAANSLGFEPYSYIEELVKLEPKRIHLSDLFTTTKMDEHLNYGLGTVDYQKLFEILPSGVNITIETNKKSKENLDDYKKDTEFLKEILR